MKKLFHGLATVLLLGTSTASQAFFWDNDNGGCPPWAYDCNPYDEWDPRYWMEEMEDVWDDNDYYGGPGYGYGGYGPGYGYGPGPGYGYGGPGYGPGYGGPGYGPGPGYYAPPPPPQYYGPGPGYAPAPPPAPAPTPVR